MTDLRSELDQYILQNFEFVDLPASVRSSLGQSRKEYDKAVLDFSLTHQLRWRRNLIRHVITDERRYYIEVLRHSKEHLLLYPYHLQDIFSTGLQCTPFTYYHNILEQMLKSDRSYDSLPNFPAADCLQLLGIGRNQYIELANRSKSGKGLFRKRVAPRLLLPTEPVQAPSHWEAWWTVNVAYVTEDDVRGLSSPEHTVLDRLIDRGTATVLGVLDRDLIESLYRRGLVYVTVPIQDDDRVVVVPLEGFVMNRSGGDAFETLLYKTFVSIDEYTTVADLATLLGVDSGRIKDAVSIFCRLGFARKKLPPGTLTELHLSWVRSGAAAGNAASENATTGSDTASARAAAAPGHAVAEGDGAAVGGVSAVLSDLIDLSDNEKAGDSSNAPLSSEAGAAAATAGRGPRIALLFDSSLTAMLMMGNLSSSLKKHAVTMFERGKLSDETLDSFIAELDNVSALCEGETQRYFSMALTLKDTLRFLRRNARLGIGSSSSSSKEEVEKGEKDFHQVQATTTTKGLGVDLLRCESINALDTDTCARVLQKNYSLLVSMSPLARDVRSVASVEPPHVGPAIPEMTSLWFKLWLYETAGSGPPSILFVAGTQMRRLPVIFDKFDTVMVTSWAHDPSIVNTSNLLPVLNDALLHAPVLVQGYGHCSEMETLMVPLPLPTAADMEAATTLQVVAGAEAAAKCAIATSMDDPETDAKEGSTPKKAASPSPSTPPPPHAVAGAGAGVEFPRSLDSAAAYRTWVTERAGLITQPALKALGRVIDLTNSVGHLTFVRAQQEAKVNVEIAESTSANITWILHDCSFGLPLFDDTLSFHLRKVISEHGLFTPKKLAATVRNQRAMSLSLLDFIARNQGGTFDASDTYPTTCLMFSGAGRVRPLLLEHGAAL